MSSLKIQFLGSYYNFNYLRGQSLIPTFSEPVDNNLGQDCIVKSQSELDIGVLTNCMSSHRLLDLGGVGDCFLLCLNRALMWLSSFEPNVKIYEVDRLYELLGLPLNKYIEDENITILASYLNLNIYVGSILNNEMHFQEFFVNSKVDVFVFNDYPYHYFLFDYVQVGDKEYSYSDEPETKESSVIQEHDYKIMKREPLRPSTFKWVSDAKSLEVEEVDISYLYLYVESRFMLKKQNFRLTNIDSKTYYKLRHNCFKTAFLSMLGLSSVEERPFTDIGIDSNKTPDFLQKFEGVWILIEFTVVKYFETAIVTKSSRGKYNYEASLIKARGEKVKCFYPTLVLDQYSTGPVADISDISQACDVDLIQDPNAVFKNLFEDLNSLEFHIHELMPELLYNEEVSTTVHFKDLKPLPRDNTIFSVIKQKQSVKRMRDQNIFNRIRKSASSMERRLKRIKYKAKFQLVFDISTNNVYLNVSEEGLSKNVMLNLIQNMSTQLLDHVTIKGKYTDVEEPFQKYGIVDLTVNDEREQQYVEEFDVAGYEDYYYTKIMMDSKKQSSVFHSLADINLEEQVAKVYPKYMESLAKKRSFQHSEIYNKNPFIFPVASGLKYGKYNPIKLHTSRPVLNLILAKVTSVSTQELRLEREVDFNAMNDLFSKQNRLFRNLIASGLSYKVVKTLTRMASMKPVMEFAKTNSFQLEQSQIDMLIENIKVKKLINTSIGEPTRQAYRNRVTVTKKFFDENWDQEIEHFRQVKGKIRMCVDHDVTSLKEKFLNLLEFLFSPTEMQTPDDIFSNTEIQGGKFSNICSEILDEIREIKDNLLATSLMHNLLFISRVCYTLLYMSNIKLNKEDFIYDNMGYENCLLIVKGGKKVLSTKSSRLFTLIFPVDEKVSWLYPSVHTKLMKDVSGQMYCIFPWQIYKFEIMKKGTELYYCFPNYYLSSYVESDLNLNTYNKFVSVKVLNMFSQRRKVEIWMSTFRYIYLNSLATNTDILMLIDDMVDYDYDMYFYCLQRLFAANYANICKESQNLKIFDMLTGIVVDNFDLCAEKFDESLFMAMAPFSRENEHIKNLRGILGIHDNFKLKYSCDPDKFLEQSSLNANSDDYFKRLSEEDFTFDPKLAFCIGKYASNYLARVLSQESLANQFTRILSQSYTNISTSKGMRQAEGRFWGSKGHDVLLTSDENENKVVDFVTNLPVDNKDFRKRMENSEVSFLTMIESLTEIVLEFDVKDKQQFKGSREIYVMTDKTKLVQQPIELMFKHLSNYTPNELIHKKSHIRPKFIHTQVFEYESASDVKMYCTLDCSKWAPKCNIWKYYYFVLGMQKILPKEFVDYFMTIWRLMLNKKVRIQKRYHEILHNNEKTKHLADHLVEREDGDYELILPYSFMMGIYNYLSSFFHAFTQLYFNDKIASKLGVTFNLIAHSDDSGGVVISNSYKKSLKAFRMYEIFQKSCNHILSRKKSSLSKNFFEIISIMYANKRLVPMTHKFVANVSFNPKGMGWYDDITTVVSKVIEVFSNGGTMRQCYYTMLSMGEMIRKFYHIPRVKNLSKLPLAFGGLFNMHPIHLVLLGASAQEVMLDYMETDTERSFRIGIYKLLTGGYTPGLGANLKYKIPYYKRHKSTLELSRKSYDILKLTASCFPRRTLGKILEHYSKLKDPNYLYSLEGVDMCQIFTMTLFCNTMILKGDDKFCDMRKFSRIYSILQALGASNDNVETQQSNYLNYLTASESIKIQLSDITIPSRKTCKPITYSTFQNIGLGLSFQHINELNAYLSEHNLKFLFEDTNRLEVFKSWVKTTLQIEDDTVLTEWVMKLTTKDIEKVRSSYTFLPSGIAVDTTERFWTYINFYCTKRYYISTKKPQYFTIDQFLLWNAEYEQQKHHCLLIKVIMESPNYWELEEILLENCNCGVCLGKEIMRSTVKELIELRSLGEGQSRHTLTPFVTYDLAQKRGTNVWYGASRFTLYTKFGSVRYHYKEGVLSLDFKLYTEEHLDEIYFLIRNFCETRGLMLPTISYSVNDSVDKRISFTDLNRPMVCDPGYKGMIMENTTVESCDFESHNLTMLESRLCYDGMPVDFEIYQNYDVNPEFYKAHKIWQIENLVTTDNLVVDRDTLLDNMTSSKCYQVISLDPTHNSTETFEDKYDVTGLLGSERSFSRALVMADNIGLTKYRSSVHPNQDNRQLLETQSYKNIPVVDLIDQISFARINYRERKLITKIIREVDLNQSDVDLLDHLVSKIGLQPTFSAITVIKVVFNTLSYTDVKKIPVPTLVDFMYIILKSALNSIEEKTSKMREKGLGSKAGIINKLAFMFLTQCDNQDLAEYIFDILYVAQSENPGSFWDLRKSNIYAAIFKPDKKYRDQQCLFIYSCLEFLKRQKQLGKIFEIRQLMIGQRNVKSHMKGLLKKIKKSREYEPVTLEGRPDLKSLSETNWFIDTDDDDEMEEALDCIQGGEEPEEFETREWDEDNDPIEFTVLNNDDVVKLIEKTVFKDFSTVTLRTLMTKTEYKWLGKFDAFEEVDSLGIKWMVQVYPGRSTYPDRYFQRNVPRLIRKEANPIKVTKEQKELINPKKHVDRKVFKKLEDEVDVIEYQRDLLRQIGITDTDKYLKYFYKPRDFNSEDAVFSNIISREDLNVIVKNIKLKSRAKRTDVLPGFSGTINDPIISAELRSIFGEHIEEIVSGNHCISENAKKMLLRSIRRLITVVDDNKKAQLILILSIMKDSIVTKNEDWFLDPIMGIVNNIEDTVYRSMDTSTSVPRPNPMMNIYNRKWMYTDEDLS